MTRWYCRDAKGAELMNGSRSTSVYIYTLVYKHSHVLLYLFIFTIYRDANNCRINAPYRVKIILTSRLPENQYIDATPDRHFPYDQSMI